MITLGQPPQLNDTLLKYDRPSFNTQGVAFQYINSHYFDSCRKSLFTVLTSKKTRQTTTDTYK